MNRWIITSGLAGALALPLLIAPATASASCNDRKVAGTVVGGVGGALIGNSIAHGGGGAVLGGLGGAVLGHEVARSSCRHEYERSRDRHAEHERSRYRSPESGPGSAQGEADPSAAGNAQTPSQETGYYDNRGNVVYPSGAGPSASHAPNPTATTACDIRSYYNDRGVLVQTCAP